MLVGTLCAAGAGIVMPVFSIIFGDIIDAFHGPDPVEEVREIFVVSCCIRIVVYHIIYVMYTFLDGHA